MESAAFPDLADCFPCYWQYLSLFCRVGKIAPETPEKRGVRAAEISQNRSKFGITLFIPCLSGKIRVRPELSGLRRAPYSPAGLQKLGIHLELPRGARRLRRRFQLLSSRLSPAIEMSPLRRATVGPPPAATCLHHLRGEAGIAICPPAPSPAPARDRWFRVLPALQRSKRRRYG